MIKQIIFDKLNLYGLSVQDVIDIFNQLTRLGVFNFWKDLGVIYVPGQDDPLGFNFEFY